MRSTITRSLVLAAAVPLLLGACDGKSPLEVGDTALTSISPAGGAIGVDAAGLITISFNHAVMSGMQQYAALHEGSVTGPSVSGTWGLSADATKLTFAPAATLKRNTQYTIHLGGSMVDATGHMVDMSSGQMMGGQVATGSMMTGGGMMQGNTNMMGGGWKAANGNYGMVFGFTTG